MAGILSRDSRIIRDSLLAIPGVSAALAWSGITKIFFEDAPANVPLPYVGICHSMGGVNQSSFVRITEPCWEVLAHSASLSEVMAVYELLEQLDQTWPVVGIGECAFDKFEVLYPISIRYTSQNSVLYKAGVLLRVPIMEA